MYNIGFISLAQPNNHKRMNDFKGARLLVKHIDKYEIAEYGSSYDGIIIEEKGSENIAIVCELILKIKKQTKPLIWVVSEEVHSTAHIVYFKLGVDNVFSKKTNSEKIKLLMTNALDRYKKDDKQEKSYSVKNSELEGVQLVPNNFSVIVDGDQEIQLTKLEFKTIECLRKNPRKAVSYEDIYKNVWNKEVGNKQYRISNLIFQLRKKIEKDTSCPVIIKTIHSKGYMLNI